MSEDTQILNRIGTDFLHVNQTTDLSDHLDAIISTHYL